MNKCLLFRKYSTHCDILEDVDFVGVVHCKMQCLFFYTFMYLDVCSINRGLYQQFYVLIN